MPICPTSVFQSGMNSPPIPGMKLPHLPKLLIPLAASSWYQTCTARKRDGVVSSPMLQSNRVLRLSGIVRSDGRRGIGRERR